MPKTAPDFSPSASRPATGRTVRTIRQPAPQHAEDFARVVAALPAHTAR